MISKYINYWFESIVAVNDIDYIILTVMRDISYEELQIKMKEKAEKTANGKQVKCITYTGSRAFKNTQEISFFIEYEDN